MIISLTFAEDSEKTTQSSAAATSESSESQSQDAVENSESATGTEAPQQQPKKTIKLSYEEYKQLANLLVYHMRREEEEAQGKRMGFDWLI